jgi:hypothetical protein
VSRRAVTLLSVHVTCNAMDDGIRVYKIPGCLVLSIRKMKLSFGSRAAASDRAPDHLSSTHRNRRLQLVCNSFFKFSVLTRLFSAELSSRAEINTSNESIKHRFLSKSSHVSCEQCIPVPVLRRVATTVSYPMQHTTDMSSLRRRLSRPTAERGVDAQSMQD